MEIIPAIDLLAGRCVRLFQGDFSRITEYERDPLELAASYRGAGARRLHVVDLDGARTGTPRNLDVIRTLAGSGLALQAGGGIRSREMMDAFLATGVTQVVVGSVAVNEPGTALDWIGSIGPERFVLAFDVRLDEITGEPRAVTHGWRDVSGRHLWDLIGQFLGAGVRDFLCTDVSRDGTLAGPNSALYAECVRRFPEARIIASGGLSSGADLTALATTGVAAVVAGRALLDGRLTLDEMRQCSGAG